MPKILNLNKLSSAVEKTPFTKIQLAEKCGISRVTLDSVLKGKEIGLHKFLKLIDLLGLSVGYFFDEEITEVRNAGRDYVENGKIEHKGTEYNAPVTLADNDLKAENDRLKEELLDAQREIINLMKNKK